MDAERALAQLEASHGGLERLASTDFLTGAANRRCVMERVQSILRPSDLLGRVGGEEFMVLLPETGKDTALRVAGRILEQVEAMEVPSAAGGIRVSLSIGLAAFPGDGSTLEQLFRVADQRLYQAKHQGRNRVVADDSSVS